MSFHDPENGWTRRRDKHDMAIEQFIAGQIGEPTLQLTLHFLGFVGQELKAEISLAKQLKAERRGRAA